MITRFETLFTVEIEHSYYSAECKDFDFLFPGDASGHLRSKKLLAKVRSGKLHVLFETDAAGTPLVPGAGTVLRIGLRLLNPSFINVTDLDFDFGVTTPFYTNETVPAVIEHERDVVLTGQFLDHVLTDTARPVTAALRGPAGAVLQTAIVTAENDRDAVSHDLSLLGGGAGSYCVDETYPADTSHSDYYYDQEFLSSGTFGIVEVKIDSSFYTTAPNFKIVFKAREETLKYYVVAKNYLSADFNQLSVSDEGLKKILFDKVPSTSFGLDDIPAAILAGADNKVVLFKSTKPVARREQARKKIQLKKNHGILIPNLPQLSSDKSDSNVIVRIAKP